MATTRKRKAPAATKSIRSASARSHRKVEDLGEERMDSRRSVRSLNSQRSGSFLTDMAGNPAVRYVAGGIATSLLTKIVTGLQERYPELSNFLKDNLDIVEGRLSEFKNGLNGINVHENPI